MMDDTTVLPSGVELERDESNGCYRATCDSAELRTSTVVVTAVAAVTETDPLDLEPLRESLDPDALDDIFRRTPGGHVREGGCVEFSLAAHEVVVGAEGDVEIYPPA